MTYFGLEEIPKTVIQDNNTKAFKYRINDDETIFKIRQKLQKPVVKLFNVKLNTFTKNCLVMHSYKSNLI